MMNMRWTAERRYFAMIWIVTYSLWTFSFLVVGECALKLPGLNLTLALDNAIPLVPEFVWIYVLSYVFPVLPWLVATDWHRFSQGLVAFMLANVTAFVVYMALPIAMPQPELGVSLSERMLSSVYAHDFIPSANKLPSMHVAAAWLLTFMCWKQGMSRFGDVAVGVFAVLITASTVLVKQHLLIDVVAGLVWAWGSWRLAARIQASYASEESGAPVVFARLARGMLPVMTVSGLAVLVLVYLIQAI